MRKILVLGFIISLFSTLSFAQGRLTSTQLLVDTSKLENFSYYLEQNREMRKNRTVYNPSDEEVKSWYYDGENITSQWAINNHRNFNKNKLVSYPIKNIDIFNKVLNGAEMLFEYTYSEDANAYTQSVLAKYNGKYYFNYNVNHLFDELDSHSYISDVEKLKFIYKWTFWLEDPEFEILRIDKISEIFPGDSALVRRMKIDSVYVEVQMYYTEYEAFYEGKALYNGDTVEIKASIIGEKKHIKECSVVGSFVMSFSKNFQKIVIKDKTKDTGDLIRMKKNGAYIGGVSQGNFTVFYLPESSTDSYNIDLNESLATSDPMQIRLARVTGSTVNQNTVVWVSNEVDPYFNSGFDVSNILSSGFYVVEYKTSNNTWQLLSDYIIIPESHSYHNLASTGQTMKYSYLKQMFGFNNTQALEYIGYINNRFNEVSTKYITDQLILANQFVDDDGTIVTYITNPVSSNYPTYYRTDLESANAAMILTVGENDAEFGFRSNNQNISNFNNYGSENNVLAYLVAHEAFHWITRSLNPVFFHSTTIGNIDFSWMDEGLSTMSQAYCYPEIELQTYSSFVRRCNMFIEEISEKNKGVFYTNTANDVSSYYRGIFFYYLIMQQNLGIAYIKNLLTNFNMISDVNTGNYPDKIKELFDYANAQLPSSGFGSSDQILASFASQFVRKHFLPNILNYNNQSLGQLSTLGANGGYDFLIPNYSSIIPHIETSPGTGQMNVNLQIREDDAQYGSYYCAVGVWDNNNNFIESSFQEIYLNQELYAWNPVLDVQQGYKAIAILLKLNEPAISESFIYFLSMNLQETGEPISCGFCSNLEFTNTSNVPRVEIPAQNEVVFYPTATGENLTYQWSFPGGNPATSSEMTPNIYYPTVGNYNVGLTVTDVLGETCFVNKPNYVTVWSANKPVASFSVEGSTIINPGDRVKFINTSFNASSYEWSFENINYTSTSSETNPEYTFTQPGLYDVGLRAYLGFESHAITKSNYITVLNPENLNIICMSEDIIMPGESCYITTNIEAVQDDNVYYTYVFDFGDGNINEVYTNEIWVSSDWHTYNMAGDYELLVTVYNSNNALVAVCGKILAVRDMFQPVYVNLVVDPAIPSLGQSFNIFAETDAYGDRTYTWYANGTQFNNPNDFFNHIISVPGTYTYKVVVQDFSGRPAGEDVITISFADPGNCIVANLDAANSCFQYGQPMFIKSTSYCSNADCCFAFNGNNQLNQITDIRWTLIKDSPDIYCVGQTHKSNYYSEDFSICDLEIPPNGSFKLVLEVWNRYSYYYDSDNTVQLNSNIANCSWQEIFLTNEHLNNPYYDKLWVWLSPAGYAFTGTQYLCGNHPSSKTYTKDVLIAADHNGCSYVVSSGENIIFSALTQISLRKGFSANVNSNFHAKIDCGSGLGSHTAPVYPPSWWEQLWDWITNSDGIDLTIYPNPSNNIAKLLFTNHSFTESAKMHVEVLTIEGRVVEEVETKFTNDYSIDISNLPPSVYLIKIEVEDYVFTKQLTVQ
jgi:hypothetical protein